MMYRSIARLNNRLETLENRLFLCASDALTHAGVPADWIADGHVMADKVGLLSDEQRALIDPHLMEDPRFVKGMTQEDWNELLNIDLNSTPTGGQEVIALPDFYPALSGSFSTDQTSQSGRTLLRFGTQVNNMGAGPGSLISGRPGVDAIPAGAPITSWVNPDGSQNVIQAVYNWTGSQFTFNPTANPPVGYYRAAGRFTYHAGHGHFHFDGYANYKLRYNTGGVPGAYVTRSDGTGVVGAKTGFCLINVSSSFTLPNGQSSTTLPGYSAQQPSTGCGLLQGVSVGRADVYGSSLEGQWIDVTGVPNGQYFLEMQLDGENAVEESDEVNNTRTFAVTLNVNPPIGGITPDVFDTGTNNNTLANAADMGVMGSFNQTGLSIHWGQDFDYFRFVASSTGNYSVSTTAANGNVDLYLFDSAGNQIGASSNSSGTDTITYPFVEGQTYFAMAQAYNSTTSSNYQMTWNLKPKVTNAVGVPTTTEGSATAATFVLARNGPTTSPLTISYTLGGTAQNGVDYVLQPTQVTLGDLQSTALIEIVPISDSLIEGTETVTLTINGNSAYVIGGAPAQQVTINDPVPAVTQAAQVWQTSPHKLTFGFSSNVGASLSLSDISVIDLATSNPVTPSSLSYDDVLNVATVTFAGALPDGRYRATLIAAGITNSQGYPLASDYDYNFFTLAGDANHDASVNGADFNILATNFGQDVGQNASLGDFDYIGVVDSADFNILAGKFGYTLPGSESGRAAGMPGGGGSGGIFGDGSGIGSGDDDSDILA